MPLAETSVAPYEFAAWMAPLGPFEPSPVLAVAVSGGADSLCLAFLAAAWARARAGRAVGLIVDHGLRAASAEEARITRDRLAGRGIEARILKLDGLAPGPAAAARARAARYDALLRICAEQGILHLLLGHHAGDQAETRMMRAEAASGPAGLACMAALRETDGARLLRPLLDVAPERLRATLRDLDAGWIEDPSNSDPAALRTRLRPSAAAARSDLCAAARADGRRRAEDDARAAAELARVTFRPEGFAIVPGGKLGASAWSAAIQAAGGAPYPPPPAAVAALADDPSPRTLAGVRISRSDDGLLLTREEAAVGPPRPFADGMLWDGRFRASGGAPAGTRIGALGADAAKLRRLSDLPSVVLRSLPALRIGDDLICVPHIGFGAPGDACADVRLGFAPPRPAACAPFAAAG